MAIRIFIDQGHNPSGHNAGAEGNGLREQDVTYNVGIYLASLLNDDVRFQARVSRPTAETGLGIDNATSLQERVNMANSWPADYFISIHCNSNTNPEINGTEVYVYRANTQSYWLAQHILNGIVERVGTRDNGVRINPSLFVLRRTTMPAALVELAYLSNWRISGNLLGESIRACLVILVFNLFRKKSSRVQNTEKFALNPAALLFGTPSAEVEEAPQKAFAASIGRSKPAMTALRCR